jgi:hypothetical protein
MLCVLASIFPLKHQYVQAEQILQRAAFWGPTQSCPNPTPTQMKNSQMEVPLSAARVLTRLHASLFSKNSWRREAAPLPMHLNRERSLLTPALLHKQLWRRGRYAI